MAETINFDLENIERVITITQMNSSVSPGMVLELRDLEVGYGPNSVLVCKNLQLMRGEVLALLGASGTGKTTLFSVLAGHSRPLGGQLLMNSQPVQESWQLEKVARTIQSFPLLHWLNVEQNLKLAAKLRRVPHLEPIDLLDRVVARHLVNRWPSTLSGGERCRVSLAMCLLSDPALLLLDEPFSGLDVLTKKEAADTILSFVKQQQCAAVFVTHDLEDAMEYSGRIAVIRRGAPSQLAHVWPSAEPNLRAQILSSLT